LERRSVTNIARLTFPAMVLLTGCATIRGLQARDTEELLTAAGFKKQLVDAADTKPLDAGPPYRLVSRTKDGTVQYTYADPDNCRCVYLGSSPAGRRAAASRRRRVGPEFLGTALRFKLDSESHDRLGLFGRRFGSPAQRIERSPFGRRRPCAHALFSSFYFLLASSAGRAAPSRSCLGTIPHDRTTHSRGRRRAG